VFWLQVRTELKNRGVQDLLIACVDGLTGFPEAIETVYPQSQVQLCIVHQVRTSLKYVSYKDRKAVAADLKKIYRAATAEEAESQLASFGEIWDDRYPMIHRSWSQNWEQLTAFFVLRGDPPGHLHDQCHRVAQQLDAEDPQDAARLSQRRGGRQAHVPGLTELGQEVDHADPELAAGSQSVRHPLRGSSAAVLITPKATYTKHLTDPMAYPRSNDEPAAQGDSDLLRWRPSPPEPLPCAVCRQATYMQTIRS